ncbi:EF-hand domain-containing family member B isoform X2 [Nomia melanderi]|uniref:EF-hand domain-containing family member B isoform X2 n=1 Tax=Nomia melanderi TaxID=2448451 RepID=UPI003FCECE8F
MKMYCINIQNELLDKNQETRNYFNKKFKENRTNNVKECLTEYSLEDKMETLKYMIAYNAKSIQNVPQYRNIVPKPTVGVKECLEANQDTQFQTLISELRNTVMNSYWNKEVGKTRYNIPNLPIGLNPWETKFGKKNKFETPIAELLHAHENQIGILNPDILNMYKKSHNNYQPAEQMKRNYKEPFNPNSSFGQSNSTSIKNAQVKKHLTWCNSNSFTLVNSILADFKTRSQPCLGEVRNFKKGYSYMNMVHGKSSKKQIKHETNILTDSPVNKNIIDHQKYLQYVNSLRQKFKKCVPEIPFLDIYEELCNFDKDYIGILPEERIFSTVAKYKMYLNKEYLIPLLDLLLIRKDKNINYKKFLNLLNWKYDFPTFPKVDKILLECEHYNTVYNNTIGNIKEIEKVLHGSLEDKTFMAYNLISPTIFTKYGISHNDLCKLRTKEEIKDIFENIGVQFPDDSFNLIWEKGLEKYNTQNLSVETFKNLCDRSDMIVEMDKEINK